MSTRDLIWFKTNSTVHWTTTKIATGDVDVVNVTANATNTVSGPVLGDGHKQLRGTIEHINASIEGSAATFSVVFFDRAFTTDASINAKPYIDHESFVAADFLAFGNEAANTGVYAGKSALEIPYQDLSNSKQFHIGIFIDAANTSIAKDTLVLQWAFRPDVGGN